jgi:hypothetical protein
MKDELLLVVEDERRFIEGAPALVARLREPELLLEHPASGSS